jgi:hypothetical protein
MTFHRLPIARQDLNLALVLKCGQSFRWRVSGPNEWYTPSRQFLTQGPVVCMVE